MFDHLTGDFEICHYAAPPNYSHGPRTIEPNIEEIEVIVAGRGIGEFDGQPFKVGPANNIWYHPGDTVIASSDKSDPYEAIVFRFGVSKPTNFKPNLITSWQSITQCTEFCHEAMTSCQNPKTIDIDKQDVVCFYARLIWEARKYQRQKLHESLPIATKLALRFIQLNHHKEISVAQIATAAGVSPSHLHLLFKVYLSTTPIQYLIHHRILTAQKMLLKTSCSVKEICYAVGFNDMKYFCTRFKCQTSYRPSEYRERFFK